MLRGGLLAEEGRADFEQPAVRPAARGIALRRPRQGGDRRGAQLVEIRGNRVEQP
jgi:hypothetical protein